MHTPFLSYVVGPTLLLLSLSHLSYGRVSSPTTVVKMVGKSVSLDANIKKTRISDMVSWKIGQKIIVRYIIETMETKVIVSEAYTNRVETDARTFSLTLKHLLKSDSGRYESKLLGETEIVSGAYYLSVLDPVVPPILTVLPEWSDSNNCNVTLNCTAHNSSLTASCDKSSCTVLNNSLTTSCNRSTCWQQDKIPTGSSLTLSVIWDYRAICNHSNDVSCESEILDIQESCQVKNGLNSRYGLMAVPAVAIVAVLAVVVVFLKRRRKRNEKDEQENNTVYATVKLPTCTGEEPSGKPVSVYAVVKRTPAGMEVVED